MAYEPSTWRSAWRVASGKDENVPNDPPTDVFGFGVDVRDPT